MKHRIFGLPHWAIGIASLAIADGILIAALQTIGVIIAVVADIFLMLVTAFLAVPAEYRKTQKKVFYIRSLSAEICAVMPAVKNLELSAKLKKLQDDIRYSDPMTHIALRKIEKEIAFLVGEIVSRLSAGNEEGVSELLDSVCTKLRLRNETCKNYK